MNSNPTDQPPPPPPAGKTIFTKRWRRFFFPMVIALTTMLLIFAVIAYFSAQRISRIEVDAPAGVALGPDGGLWATGAGTPGAPGDGRLDAVGLEGVETLADGLDDPQGLAWVNGAWVVADGSRLWRVAPDGAKSVWRAPEDFPSVPKQLSGLAATGDGALIVSDRQGGVIYRVPSEGEVTVWLGPDGVPLQAPSGVAVGPDGTVWVADFGRGTVVGRGPDGSWTEVADGLGTPDGLAHAPDGTLYVADTRGGRVWQIPPNGTPRQLVRGLRRPAGLAYDAANHRLIVAEQGSDRVTVIALKF